MCHFRDLHKLALILHQFPQLSMRDRFQLACAPVKTADPLVVSTYTFLMRHFAAGQPCPLRIMVPHVSSNLTGTLSIAESVYRSLDLYLWLATHFPLNFLQISEARAKREQCGLVVDRVLELMCSVGRTKPETKKAQQQPKAEPAGADEIGRFIDRLGKGEF